MAAIAQRLQFERGRQAHAENLDAQKIKDAKVQLQQFQKILRDFANKHKDAIHKDPEFRDSFTKMCDALDVDPLQSHAGFWAKALQIGDFYHELAVKIIDTCDPLKRKYGALIPLGDVIASVRETYGRSPPRISSSDIRRALKSLKDIGQGYQVVTHGGKPFVKTVAFGCDQDGSELLELAKDSGYFQYRRGMAMGETRFQAAVTALMNDGLIWVDLGGPDRIPLYWVVAFFPGFQ
jgi:ESCRT-II complex subunit VPS22